MPTVSETGVVPPGGITVSQLPPEVVDAATVTAIGEPPLVMDSAWFGGVAPLIVKLSDVGEAPNVAGGGVVTAGVSV
jgi:hypothetical protein